MNQEIESTVSELYALRAGLSAVAQEYDGFQQDCKKAYDALENARNRTKQLEEQNAKAEKYLQDMENSLTRTKSELDSKRKSEKELLERTPVKTHESPLGLTGPVLLGILGAALLLLCAYIVVGVCVAEKAIPDWTSNGFLRPLYESWFIVRHESSVTYDFEGGNATVAHDFGFLILLAGIVAFIGGVAAIVGSVWLSLDFWADVSSAKSDNKERVGKWEQKKTDLRSEIVALESKARKLESDIPLRKQQIEDIKQLHAKSVKAQGITDEEKFRVDVARKGNNHLFAGKALYDELLKQFNPTVDERDWSNLDYLIYAMETGRADSMKEALQMCDKELQTERLERSMAAAAAQVSRTVSRGLGSLQAQMEMCFHRISNDIHENARVVSGAIQAGAAQISASIAASSAATNARIEQLTGTVQEGNARLAQIATTSSLNSALLAKSNEYSHSLVEDANRLRTYADFRWRKEL